MSSLSFKEKLTKLGDHYKVKQGIMSVTEWQAAIKRAAKSHESIEVLYGRIAEKGTTSSAPTTKKEVDADAVPVLATTSAYEVDDAARAFQQKIEVAAPVITVNIPPRTSGRHSSPAGQFMAGVGDFGRVSFIFGAGFVLGVLASAPVLKKFALQIVAGN